MSFNSKYAKEEGGKTFTPPEAVQSAARKALKWIEEGHAGGGFTGVGRGRAHQLANGESLSLSTVKRMHSYFSRHRVDKQGKDWNKPSPGKVAWYAWGADAGASWAAGIVKKHDGKKESSLQFDDLGFETSTTFVYNSKNAAKDYNYYPRSEAPYAQFRGADPDCGRCGITIGTGQSRRNETFGRICRDCHDVINTEPEE